MRGTMGVIHSDDHVREDGRWMIARRRSVFDREETRGATRGSRAGSPGRRPRGWIQSTISPGAGMANQVLFVHGGGGGAYEEDQKLVASLRSTLGADHLVRYPKMPNEEEPDY